MNEFNGNSNQNREGQEKRLRLFTHVRIRSWTEISVCLNFVTIINVRVYLISQLKITYSVFDIYNANI